MPDIGAPCRVTRQDLRHRTALSPSSRGKDPNCDSRLDQPAKAQCLSRKRFPDTLKAQQPRNRQPPPSFVRGSATSTAQRLTGTCRTAPKTASNVSTALRHPPRLITCRLRLAHKMMRYPRCGQRNHPSSRLLRQQSRFRRIMPRGHGWQRDQGR